MKHITLLISCLLGMPSLITATKIKYIKHFPAWSTDLKELKQISPVLALFMEPSQTYFTLEQLEKKMDKALKHKHFTTHVHIDITQVPYRAQDPIIAQIKHWNSNTTVISTHIINILSAPKIQTHIQQCSTCKHLKTMVEQHCSIHNKEKVTPQGS